MATGSPSSSSSSNFDVFLSFRGEDTRHGFTGHLYNTLQSKGIHTFIDDEELKRGEEITPALMKAIPDSRVAITVLSEHYASSSFCLDELATILDQRKRLLVIPVFYKVDPSDVRNQRGSYGEALAKLERRFQHDPEKLQKWKMALKQVADLSGYHFKEGDGYEFKFIEKIVEQVSGVISLRPLHVADYPVGLESRVLHVRSLLDAGSDDGVHMIGIHGMGGIGKSTLARAVYNELIIAEKFDSLCFLANVRENSNKHGLEHLQGKLLLEILGDKNINLTSKQQGISIIQSRLTGKKVLLILDDVDTREQLQAIAGRPGWFGPGSKIIITTRDQQLLRSHEVNKIYEVKELDENDALQLLTWEAFKKEKAYPTYEEVLHRVVTYASGLPLALEVIGSHLVGKSIQEWESAIKQYKRIPKKEILDILKVSFDALEEEEKKVFLDIACCFKGWRLTEVERILRGDYDDSMEHHIGVLIKKSLINVSGWDDVVTMHDLIQDMGRRIDQQESSKEPGKGRRLWLTKDIIEVLEDNLGSSEIEIICLDFSLSEKEATIEWEGDAFKKMKNLKILIIRNGKFSQGPNYFPESLRVLEWHRYPSNCLPSNFPPKELAICKLPQSCITSFGFHGSRKKFWNLKVLNFEECEFLTEIPDVSDLPNLEELSFDRCGNLITVHHSIGFLSKLKILSAKSCSKLTTFPPLNLTSLETLQLSYCSSLENFPEILGEMKNLLMLELLDLGLKELPVSFQNLVGLETLSLRHCGILLLPINIVMMPKLASLDAESCKGWQWVKSEEGEEKVGSIVCSNVYHFSVDGCNLYDDFFSTGFMQLDHVKILILRKNNFTFLPECIKELQFLRSLDVSGCLHLQEIRGVPPNLKEFTARECISLSSSSLSMLSNQELHEAGQTVFLFPGATIPEWFNHQSRGPSSSFWFRNEFPDNVLCLLLARVECLHLDVIPRLKMFINGKRHKITSRWGGSEVRKAKLNYTYLFDLKSAFELDDLSEVALEKEWNHVEITYAGLIETSLFKATGIHVLRQDDIRYDDPYGKRKLEHDLNSFESQPLIKKPRLFCRLSRWVGPERIINLLGNAADGTLITNAQRRYRQIPMDSFCRRCDFLEDTCLHALRDCPKVAAFWRSVLPKKLAPKFFNGDVTVWLETNLSFSEAAFFWPTFFGIAVELLWEYRNDLKFFQHVFGHGAYSIDPSKTIDIVFKRYKDYMRAHASPNLMTRNLLKWKPENFKDWLLRLNVSGAYDPSSGTAACGGIFSGNRRRFVLGFSVKLGECLSIDEAEIWGIYHGMKIARKYDIWGLYRDILRQHNIPISLEIARQHDFGKIFVESGSEIAIEFVLDGCPTSTSTSTRQHCFPLCQELKALTSATNHSYLFYTQHNAAADSFAKFGLSMKQQAASIFSACPSFCQSFIPKYR
ncbi:TMV resistance protein N-like isoform X1 [Glycine soja]|uniref:TMV resistance protein N-like isoform X1 n=1 Tax=Glycine soja TaxID=3848 RepID=UPI00103D6F7B|nr:TMV resistance protein N-like isoform X1 [Glycine soja]